MIVRLVWAIIPLAVFSIIGIQESLAESVSTNISQSLLHEMEYMNDTIPNYPLYVHILSADILPEEFHSNKIIEFIQKNNGVITEINKGTHNIAIRAKISSQLIGELDKMHEDVVLITPMGHNIDDVKICMSSNGGQFSHSLKKLIRGCGFTFESVNCSTGKIIIYRNSDNTPACVTPKTAEQLFERSWTRTDFKSDLSIPDIETTWITFPEMTYADLADLELHKKLLTNYYDKQGIDAFYVNYEILAGQHFGEACEGSFTTYGVTVLASESDSEKLKNMDLQSYFPEAGYCGFEITVTEENISEEIVIEEKESELILNPINLLDVIPQDITFDYVLKMPPDDIDSFAEKLVTYANDTITEIEQKELEKKYTTQKGWMTIRNQMDITIKDYALNYVLYERNAIKIDKADEFKNGLYETLGITFDGTEFTREGVPSSTGISYLTIQQKDEMLVLSNKIKIDFDSGYTLIHIGNWNNNLSEMVLYDLEKSEQNGREYALKFEELTEPDCDIKFKEIEGYGETTLFILQGRPIYDVFAGTCQVPYVDGHYHWYSTFVDALTGKPLFVKNKSVF